MEYIDKTILREEGEAIIKSFLNQVKEQDPYPQDLYDVFKSDRGGQSQKDLIEILLEEQNNHCCYCMRRLTVNNKITLEHLILRSITQQEEFNKYIKEERHTVLNDNVCLTEVNKVYQAEPPYPHVVAYQNLVASCDGKIITGAPAISCCNLRRGFEYIEPIVLYATIKNEVVYAFNGEVRWKEDKEYEKEEQLTMNILGLNDSILRMVRHIWSYINRCGLVKGDIDRDRGKLYGMLDEVSNEDFDLLLSFQSNDTYWNLLVDYDYFSTITYHSDN
ncbi:MAG: hypothetical protein LBN06_09315 [Prevotellaceae bacterium]|jgi:hypothetical protein|nr:hypothetical protein [Prevotellaceae bacterium]